MPGSIRRFAVSIGRVPPCVAGNEHQPDKAVGVDVEAEEVVEHMRERGHAGPDEMVFADGQTHFQAAHHRCEMLAGQPGGDRILLDADDAVDLPRRHAAAGDVVQPQHLLQRRQAAAGQRQLIQRQVRDQPPLRAAPVAEPQWPARLAQQADRARRRSALDRQVASGDAIGELAGQIAIAAGEFDADHIGLRQGRIEFQVHEAHFGFVTGTLPRHILVAPRHPILAGALGSSPWCSE